MKYHILQISLTDAEVDLINEKGHDAVARHARHLNNDILIHDYDHVADFEVGSILEVITLGNEEIDRNNHPQIDIVIDNPEQGLASISKGDIIIESKSKRVYYINGYDTKVLDVKPEELKGLLFDKKEVA